MVTVMLSMFRRLVLPSVLRTCRRTGPGRFTVNEAVCKVALVVLTVLPTLAYEVPLLAEVHSSQVLPPLVPYTAWSTVTTPAPPLRSTFMLSMPLLRTRADWVPVLASAVVLPIKASSNVQLPEARVTVPTA